MSDHDPEFAALVHDLSQLLWSIQGRARIIATRVSAEEAAQLASLAEDAGLAAAMLGGGGEPVCDLDAVVAAAWRQACAVALSVEASPRSLTMPTTSYRVAVTEPVLRRVLGNLFLNSLEAMPQRGGVHCTVEVAHGRVQLLVRDEGPGLPAAALARLFEDGNTHGKQGGRGLGLAGARRLLRHQNGDVQHVPGPGGAAFRLLLPLAHATADTGDAAVTVLPARLLVVDDDPAVRNMLQEMLGLDGHQTTLASDHDQALALFAPGALDAVLIDLGLPGRSGTDLAVELRAMDSSVALIMMTGWGRERELRTLPDGLADFTLTKPVDLPDLRGLLAASVRRATARRDQSRET